MEKSSLTLRQNVLELNSNTIDSTYSQTEKFVQSYTHPNVQKCAEVHVCIHHCGGESDGLSVALEMMETQSLALHMCTDLTLSAGADLGGWGSYV